MAQGDDAGIELIELTDADTMVVVGTSGNIDGERWRVRLQQADAWERVGPDQFLGQGAVLAARAWWDEAGGLATAEQVGVDQWGRLVATVTSTGVADSLDRRLIDGGWAIEASVEVAGSDVVLSWTPRRAGAGIAESLVVDTTRP